MAGIPKASKSYLNYSFRQPLGLIANKFIHHSILATQFTDLRDTEKLEAQCPFQKNLESGRLDK